MASPDLVAKRWTSARKALREVFHFDSLRPFQETSIGAVLEGRDVFAVSSTGSGKSLAFGLPAMVLPGTAVVISPLLALMKDQDQKMRALGVPSCRLTSDESRASTRDYMRRLDEFEIIYVSPEKARTKEFRTALGGIDVSLFALDEAHMASRASDFRPDYAHLTDMLEEHPGAVRFACTATADARVEEDVRRIFALRDPVRIVSTPWRDNIKWEFVQHAGPGDLVDVVKEYHDEKEGSQVVYVSSRAAAEELRHVLRGGGIETAAYYHAGMERRVRMATQEQFMEGLIRCVIATSAFGMGVDKSDIRLVANYDMPSSLFDLLQQTGRASRDGKEALGWVNLGTRAEKAQRFFIEMSNPRFRVYERLWAKFAQQDGPQMWSTDILMRVAGVGDRWEGHLTSALAYLEFTGHIQQTPAGSTYRLPIRDYVRASRIAALHGGQVRPGTVTYTVKPGQEDMVRAFVLGGACEWAPANDSIVIRPLAGALKLTEDDILDKHLRATEQLEMIYDFSKAKDKKKFVEDAFAQSH